MICVQCYALLKTKIILQLFPNCKQFSIYVFPKKILPRLNPKYQQNISKHLCKIINIYLEFGHVIPILIQSNEFSENIFPTLKSKNLFWKHLLLKSNIYFWGIVMYVLRPISIHLCHQKPNPARETVPLKSIFNFRGKAMYGQYGFLFIIPTTHKFTVHETQNIFSFRNVMNTKIVLAILSFFCWREKRETKRNFEMSMTLAVCSCQISPYEVSVAPPSLFHQDLTSYFRWHAK